MKVFVVHAADEGCSDNRGIDGEGYTISKQPTVAGWETDGGHSSYGLTKEDAEYYAKCINDYPRLLSIIKQTEKALNDIVDSKYLTIEATRKIADEALKAIRG